MAEQITAALVHGIPEKLWDQFNSLLNEMDHYLTSLGGKKCPDFGIIIGICGLEDERNIAQLCHIGGTRTMQHYLLALLDDKLREARETVSSDNRQPATDNPSNS